MTARRVSDLGEFGLIARLREQVTTSARVVEGIGDDAAVLEGPGEGRLLLFACDTIAEGVHFMPDAAPEQIGHKALACNLSDIAAMGGMPRAITVSLGCGAETPVATIDGIWTGMRALAAAFDVDLAGGDTHRSPAGLILSVAIVGEVERELCVRRGGAKAGHFIVVTGGLGGSMLGKHMTFTPRVREGRWLAERRLVSAMIDVSDGLASDLHHVCKASNVGAELFADRVPIAEAARQLAQTGARASTPLGRALYDGEDFELLATVPPELLDEAASGYHATFGEPLYVLGRTTAGPHVTLIHPDGRTQELTASGFDHFG
ncbi:MAG: thiamine-monophosphate kinase [Verrucomicrobia bacterium]|nr:thiamine-monophosphate kinase [Verrucomicrobiota bacterium]